MNPNPFGSAPGGGVQGTSATSFEQKTPNSGSQNVGVFQPSAFGVPSATNQPSNHGSSIFGQSSAFGQQSTKATSLPSSTPAFSQPTVGVGNFGSTFGAVTGANPSFGQTPALGQPSVFGQGPGFGQKVTGSGLFSGPASSSVQHQPLSFGQSLFGRPSTTGVASSVFGATPTQSSGFVPEFSFKPANEVLFKPIFSGSSEPTNPQTSLMSSSPFGGATKKTSFTASSGAITDLLGAKSGSHGFSFSEPAAAPSLPVQNNPLTAKNTGPSSMLQFTFSQPAVPSSSNTNAPITQPKTVPTFSFSSKALQPQTAQLSAGTSIVQPSSFGEIKSKAESTSDHKVAQEGEPNVFAPFRKGMKRRDEPTTELSSNVTDVAEDEETAETSSPRQPPKRPNIRSRVPAMNLFTRALSGLRKDKSSPVRQGPNETLQLKSQEMSDQPQVLEEPLTATTFGVQTMSSVVPEKTEESESPKTPEMTAETRTPIRSGVRSDSLDSLSGMSPTDCTVIQCRNIPPALNKRNILEKHFARFGKVCKVFCRPGKNMAAVHFDNHASAAKAKKKGKYLHRKELLLLWQKKKSSPGDKSSRPTSGQKELEGAKEDTSFKAASSPLRRPVLRPPAGSTFSLNSVVKKPLLTRSLQFDTEHQKENVMEMQSTKCVVPCAILPLIGVMAETSEDKYRLLEQRDKILRQDRTKNADMDLAKVFVGTCPDMCPEKERYMRETRNQLSMYEVHANTEMVNHAAAIKEYSRSSADQEEPLPHELRPLTVLSMTMDYLVTQVIDQCPDNLQDWYDFFWNRTRAIRKDITQQRLCCPHTVSLIEKCTRFHIHCSHHLCEQPMSVFEPKINNENLTKCLQSLKEMYEDLKDCNIYCPGEAEFRQYSVLLNLNDGDILRQVQQLRDEVRNSSEVHFAVQAFAALNSNNFVRFFKLVKKASYLASCLLHIYFNQVRAKALKILNIAHTVGPRSTAFPVEDIVRILMFRSTTEAIDFIQQYNLNVNDGLVDLNRIAYQEPELLSQKKSDIILAKRSTLTGELVNGGTLPNPPQHVPVCSFDAQNKFREGIMAEPAPNPFKAIARVEVTAPPSVELQPQVSPPRPPEIPNVFGMQPAVPDNTEKSGDSFHSLALPADAQQPFQPISQPPQVKSPSPAPPPQPVFSEEDITAEVDCLIEEIVGISAREVAADGAFYVTTALVESSVQSEALLSDVLGRLLEELSSSELHLEQERVAEEKRKIEEARRKQEHEAFVAMFRLNLYTEIMLEVLDETIKDIATTVFQQAVNEKAQCVAKCSQEVCTSLIEETLKADVALLVEDILTSELQRAHKYIQRWRDVVAVRRQLKRQMRGFPAAPCFVDPRFKLKALAPSAPAQQSIEDLACGMVNLGNGGRLSFSSTRVLKTRQLAVHQMKVQCYYQQLLEELVWSPLDLPALVAENTHKKHNRIFWKAVVLLPSDHENVASPASRILSDWLVVKLGGGQESKLIEEQRDGTLQTLHLSNTIKEKEQHTFEVNVSVKVSRGPLTEDCLSEIEECLDLQGTGAMIMLLPAIAFSEPRRDELDVTLLSALLQLKQLQQASAWHCPVPLVILVPGTCNAETLEEELMLPSLVKDGFISEYKLLFIPETTNDMQGAKQLNSAIRWLLSRAPPSILLCCQTLMHLVEASLSHEFSRRVSAAWAATGLSPQDPAPVVELYNAVIRHIADKVSSEELSGIAWPPGEFSLPDTREFVPHLGWNSGPHLAWLRRLILSLQLPQWRQLSTTDTWSELCSGIYIYAAQIPVTRGNQPLIMSRLESLLERVRRKEHHRKRSALKKTLGFWNEDHNTECSAYSQIPWVDVLFICIDHKLKDWQVPGPPVCEDAVTDDGEILVYYLRESLKGFQPPEEWIKAVRLSHRVKQQDDGASSAASATPTSWPFRQGLFTSLVEPLEAQTAPLDASYTPTRVEALSHRVLHTLEEEKTESKRTTEQLQHWLDGDSLDNWCTPLLLPSSILLSMPTALKQGPPAKHRDALYTKEASTFVSAVKEEWPRTSSSLTERLKHLQQQVRASQEEESACRLKLSAMMSIVED